MGHSFQPTDMGQFDAIYANSPTFYSDATNVPPQIPQDFTFDPFEAQMWATYNTFGGGMGVDLYDQQIDTVQTLSPAQASCSSMSQLEAFSPTDSSFSGTASTAYTIPTSTENTPPMLSIPQSIEQEYITETMLPRRRGRPRRESKDSSSSHCEIKFAGHIQKRERNRVSAQKCRQKTKSKLSDLEKQAKQMATNHDLLLSNIKDLQYELIATQLKCMENIKCKCPAVRSAMAGPSKHVQLQQQQALSQPQNLGQNHQAGCQASRQIQEC